MKILIRGMVLTFICAVVLMIIMAVGGRTNRSMEINSNLSSAVEETVENLAVNPKYTINNQEEYIADFTEALSYVLDTNSTVIVEVAKVDKEKGILAVKVTEKFSHPNGNIGTVDCEKIVIFNKLEEPELEMHTVKFYLTQEDMIAGNNCYKSYNVFNADPVMIPANPIAQGKTFAGWKDVNDYMADFSQPIEQNITYYADWN